jgi:hypothetical protein
LVLSAEQADRTTQQTEEVKEDDQEDSEEDLTEIQVQSQPYKYKALRCFAGRRK